MRTMADGNSSNQSVGAVVVAGGLATLVALFAGVLCYLMVLASIKETKETKAFSSMAPMLSIKTCPKVGEQFSITVKGDFATVVTDGHRLKLVKAEPEGGLTKFTFLPFAEGSVSIHLISPGYQPEILNLRVSRFTEDAWSIKNDTGQQIEILRQVSLKSDTYNQLRFDNEPVGESYPITHFLFQAELRGNSQDEQPPVWTTSPNMKATGERTRGNDFLKMGRYGYGYSSRVSITRTAPGPGWVRLSWMGLSRTIQVPDPQLVH